MKKSYVILHGGLGNQLFQWAYGHQLAIQGKDIDFLFLEKDYLIPHTRTSLGDFLPNCSHGKFLTKKIPSGKLGKLILDPTNPLRLKLTSLSNTSNKMNTPFEYPNFENTQKYHFGYFQNHQMIEELDDILSRELFTRLNREKPTLLESRLFGNEILHVRQGDTKTPSNLKSVGVLNSKYYESLPSKGSSRRYALTDDLKGAQEILVNSNVDAIYGPQEVNVERALRIMANSTKLYTANSTLSWWGGFLAKKNGAQVTIPNPFFRAVYPDPMNAFIYGGFQTFPSSFLDN